MELNYLTIMLYVTGVITVLPGLLFIFPVTVADKLFKIELKDELITFCIRHWGLLVGIMGALIICSVHVPEIRTHILIAAIIEKAAIVFLILTAWKKDFTQGMRATVVIDTICVVLYLLVVFDIT